MNYVYYNIILYGMHETFDYTDLQQKSRDINAHDGDL